MNNELLNNVILLKVMLYITMFLTSYIIKKLKFSTTRSFNIKS